jgi:aryl-alcohol dehydrogenase-like predicted oxidoreductase
MRYRRLGSSDLHISAVSRESWKTLRPDQVRENAAAADIDLEAEVVAEIEAVFA